MAITIPVTASVATMSRPVERTGKLHLLVVDEDAAIRSACCEIAAELGFVPQTVSTIAAARTLLRDQAVDILLLDLRAPIGEGLGLLHEIKALNPSLVVVVMTAYATVPAAVEAMRTGAADYLTKPFAMDELAAVLERALERSNERRTVEGASRQLRESLRSAQGLGNLIGRSPEMDKLYRILAKVAQSSHPVLILGESGVGKELVARSIHCNGPHADRPFVPVDCGSLVPTLMESELFGYVKGAFTGANRAKEGLLASAQGGTVFLDEIGELPLDLQAKLLRALQEKEVRPVGATHRIHINVRILAATNRDLAAMVEQGRFRKDLYYRLSVVNLRIPPLRERKQEFPCWQLTFWSGWHAKPAPRIPSVTTFCVPWWSTSGQGMCASWSTRSIAPAPFPPVPYSTWGICPRSCRTFTCNIAVRGGGGASSQCRCPRCAGSQFCPWPSWRRRPFSKPCAS